MNKTDGRVTLSKLAPVLMAEDVDATITFYEQVLDFKRIATVPEQKPFVFGMVANGPIELMFQEPKSFTENVGAFEGRKPGGTVALYMDTNEIDALYKRVATQTKIVKELHETFYGTREFYMMDCNGYVLGFAEKK